MKADNREIHDNERGNPKLTQQTRDGQSILKPLLILFCLTLLFQVGSLLYEHSHAGETVVPLLLPSLFFITLITLPLGGLGLWLGRDVGLGTPSLIALLHGESGALQKLLRDGGQAAGLGLILGTLLVLMRSWTAAYLPTELPVFGYRGFWGGVLVSASAAVGEEIWFRLGLMTILIWLLHRSLGYREVRVNVAWFVIVLISIVFGLAHLPHLESYGAATLFAIGGTIWGNTAVGILYGWCFWRRGLLVAIIAHFSVDIAIHALPALLS